MMLLSSLCFLLCFFSHLSLTDSETKIFEKVLKKVGKNCHAIQKLLNSTSTPSVNLEYQKLTQESQKSMLPLNTKHLTTSPNNTIEFTEVFS